MSSHDFSRPLTPLEAVPVRWSLIFSGSIPFLSYSQHLASQAMPTLKLVVPGALPPCPHMKLLLRNAALQDISSERTPETRRDEMAKTRCGAFSNCTWSPLHYAVYASGRRLACPLP
ncbi:hypothetical protein NP233_g10410 [Leucocoprinus birnbaumii]|uniref:Uncharacterized protein n=1 Tax=Leucocoprinus birnbaumii TaxID=56174 RepID=A0AAD5YLC2_9AGAR|nr:hypothetical protein NP233_g10410 [Leucocoprinus birnbaumii]